MAEPKILFLDIETFPNLGWTWGRYEQTVIRFEKEACIASFAAKWLGGKVFACALPDYPGYRPNSYNDKALVSKLWDLLDEADVVVAHNGNSFDFKVINGRFIFHKMTPPSPYKTVDTKILAKRVARFNSNKLDDLGVLLNEGRKIKTDFDLWEGCIKGDPTAWNHMVKYNMKDVVLLEKVYKRLLPWATDHPNQGLWKEGIVCPNCGSDRLHSRGEARTLTRVYRRMQCTECGTWSRVLKSEKDRGAKVRQI